MQTDSPDKNGGVEVFCPLPDHTSAVYRLQVGDQGAFDSYKPVVKRHFS